MRRYWAIEYVNGQQWFGRFANHWGRTDDIEGAALYASAGEADVARQALMHEAEDRLRSKADSWPSQIWWDVKGGLVRVVEVEVITRRVQEAPSP